MKHIDALEPEYLCQTTVMK